MIIIPLIIFIAIMVTVPLSNVPELFLPLIVLGTVIIIGLFATLTIEVTDMHLKFWLGIGIFHKRIHISDITSCKPTHTFIPAYGIHLTHRGWLYNVSGFTLIEITLKNGKRLLLGTDESEDLCKAITKRITIVSQSTPQNVRSI
jgi:hypothetical protein